MCDFFSNHISHLKQKSASLFRNTIVLNHVIYYEVTLLVYETYIKSYTYIFGAFQCNEPIHYLKEIALQRQKGIKLFL